MIDINDVSHTSTLAKFEEAVRKDERSRTSPVSERLRQFAAYGDTAEGRIMAQLALTEIERLSGVAQRPAEGAFEKWFDNHFLDPDGGSSHLPDWLKDDLRLAWDAALSHSSIAGNSQCQQQWQPIETAPKDGNEILVSCGVGHPTRLAFWDAARNNCWSVWPGRAWIEPLYWTPLPALTDTSTAERAQGQQDRNETLRGLAAFFSESVHHVWDKDEIADCLTNMISADTSTTSAAKRPTTADAEREWERLNAVFHKALQEYPYSQHALHYLWNNTIASPGGTTSDTSTVGNSK
jgi:hypothetical protein